MSDNSIITSAIILIILIGVAGIWLLVRIARNNPLSTLMNQKSATLRERHRRASGCGIQFAEWQAGIRDSVDNRDPAPPYIGPHLLSVDKDQAILRSAGNQTCRMILYLFIILPVIGVSLLVTLQGMIYFFANPVHRTYLRDVVTDGGANTQFATYAPTIANYIRSLGDSFALYFSDQALVTHGGLWPAFSAFFMSDAFFLSLLITMLILLAVIVLRRTEAPLVFDRKRQLVFTVRYGRLYTASWSRLQMTVTIAARRTAPAFALTDREGRGQSMWFPLASWTSFSEDAGSVQGQDYDFYGNDRWLGMRSWLIAYMDGRIEGSDQPGRQFGLMRLLTPREGKLPDDLDRRIEASPDAATVA